MAKDLPYFKFGCSEWNDGDVTLCSMEAQGLFINLCSIYWSQEGDLSLAKAKRRFSGCSATAWESLINDRVIKLDGDNIVINFLDEQFEERGKLSSTNAENAAKGWEKRRQNATAQPSQSGRIKVACNIEEKREEEKRKKEKRREEPVALPFDTVEFFDAWNDWLKYRIESKKKLTDSTAKKQLAVLGAKPEKVAIAMINQSIQNGWQGIFEIKPSNNGKGAAADRINRPEPHPGKSFGEFR